MTIVIDYGERRHVKMLIHSCKNEDFQIVNVQYELIRHQDSFLEDSGLANVIDHLIDIVIEPKMKGDYLLRVTYQIADEILIESVQIKVI